MVLVEFLGERDDVGRLHLTDKNDRLYVPVCRRIKKFDLLIAKQCEGQQNFDLFN